MPNLNSHSIYSHQNLKIARDRNSSLDLLTPISERVVLFPVIVVAFR